MEIKITKKNIIIKPAPKRNVKNGLKLYLQRNFDYQANGLPTVSTDIIKGQSKYSIPNGFIYTIKGIKL